VFKQATSDLHYLSGIHQHRGHLNSLKLHLHGKKVPQRKQWVNNCWLVVSAHLKDMSSSIGMMKFPSGKMKAMFQTTNQIEFEELWLWTPNFSKFSFARLKHWTVQLSLVPA